MRESQLNFQIYMQEMAAKQCHTLDRLFTSSNDNKQEI